MKLRTISQDKAMEMLGYTNAEALRRAINNKTIPVRMYKPSKTYVYNEDDIIKYLESRQVA